MAIALSGFSKFATGSIDPKWRFDRSYRGIVLWPSGKTDVSSSVCFCTSSGHDVGSLGHSRVQIDRGLLRALEAEHMLSAYSSVRGIMLTQGSSRRWYSTTCIRIVYKTLHSHQLRRPLNRCGSSRNAFIDLTTDCSSLNVSPEWMMSMIALGRIASRSLRKTRACPR